MWVPFSSTKITHTHHLFQTDRRRSEYVFVRISTRQFSTIIVSVYRPGSSAIHSTYFEKISTALDVEATFQEAIFKVNDFIISLERSDDPNAK